MDRKRVLIIFGVAWISAALLTWFVISRLRAPQKQKTVKVMAAVRDLPVGTRIRKTDLKQVEVAERDMPRGAYFTDKDVLDRALVYPVTMNEPLTAGRLASQTGAEGVPATIDPGMRAMSVPITDVTGVAGLIQPNSRVDVLFTRTGQIAEAVTTTVLQNIKVLAIGRVYQVGQVVDPRAPKMPVATLVVTPEEAQVLELAKNQGKISLVLRNPLDRDVVGDIKPVTADAIDPAILDRTLNARRRLRSMAAGPEVPNLDDPKVWQALTARKAAEEKKKEEEKPKLVVDVFKGDKHVQEIFQ
jgi:pilus assembly protein CpaB